jgi:hypothetical protein
VNRSHIRIKQLLLRWDPDTYVELFSEQGEEVSHRHKYKYIMAVHVQMIFGQFTPCPLCFEAYFLLYDHRVLVRLQMEAAPDRYVPPSNRRTSLIRPSTGERRPGSAKRPGTADRPSNRTVMTIRPGKRIAECAACIPRWSSVFIERWVERLLDVHLFRQALHSQTGRAGRADQVRGP